MLEVGLVDWPGRAGPRASGVSPFAEAQESLRERAEEAREPVHVRSRKTLGQALRRHDAVLERVAGARRRLRAVAEHPPRAVGRAREVERDEVQMQVVARRRCSRHGRRKPGCRTRAPAAAAFRCSSALRAVEIDEQRVQEPRALRSAALERAPTRPGPSSSGNRSSCHGRLLRGRRRRLGDAVLADQPLRLVLRGARRSRSHRGERVDARRASAAARRRRRLNSSKTRRGAAGRTRAAAPRRCVLAGCGVDADMLSEPRCSAGQSTSVRPAQVERVRELAAADVPEAHADRARRVAERGRSARAAGSRPRRR